MFDLRHSFSDCVIAEHASSGNDAMLADGKLMTAVTDLKWLLTVKCACKWEDKACFELNSWVHKMLCNLIINNIIINN